MALHRIVINESGDLASASDSHEFAVALRNYAQKISSGLHIESSVVKKSAVQAHGHITSTGAATADETITVCNVVFTAKATGATGNQFNLSATVGTQAANIAAAINASSDLTGIVTASASAGVVTVTAVVPGLMGNGLALAENMTNVAVTAFSGGTDGESYLF